LTRISTPPLFTRFPNNMTKNIKDGLNTEITEDKVTTRWWYKGKVINEISWTHEEFLKFCELKKI
jgi:hypothetical protein